MSRWFVGSSSSRISGSSHDRPGQEHPALHARGELRELRVGVEADPGDDRLDAMVRAAELMVVVVQALGHLVGDGAAVALGDVLRQPRDAQALLADDRTLVRLDLAAEEAEQRALPLAIPPQQAEPLSRLDHQVDVIEQPGASEGEADFAQTQ